LRIAESDRLNELEKIIDGDQGTTEAVGLALQEIRDLKLYKRVHAKSFEAYCQAKWGWTRHQTGKLIAGQALDGAGKGKGDGKLTRLKLAMIVLDAGTQIRARLDDDTVEEYAAAMKEGAKFPPAIVFHDGSQYLLADGFHRVAAAVRNGFKDFAFDVRAGSKSETLKYALSANAQHGLKRTNADKRRSVELALAEWPHLADAELARICAVGNKFVGDTRREMEDNLVLNKVEIRVGHDGRKRKLPPVPIQPSSAPQCEQSDVPTAPPVASPAPVPPPPPSQILDGTGWPIPTQLIPLWQRTDEVQEMLTALSRVKGTLRAAQENKDTLFAEVNYSSALSQLDQAWTDIKTGKPFAVCPTCQGQVPDKCTLCRGRGLISEHRWNTCVTREDKAFREKAKAESGKRKL